MTFGRLQQAGRIGDVQRCVFDRRGAQSGGQRQGRQNRGGRAGSEAGFFAACTHGPQRRGVEGLRAIGMEHEIDPSRTVQAKPDGGKVRRCTDLPGQRLGQRLGFGRGQGLYGSVESGARVAGLGGHVSRSAV